MFTGIVKERGRVVEAPQPSEGGGARIVVGHSEELASLLELGASLSVSGVCLTVVAQGESNGAAAKSASAAGSAWSAFDLSPETLGRTTLGALQAGDEVNLEPPLSAGDPLGGHWVQGHVDTTTRVAGVEDLGENRVLTFDVPAELENGLVLKGSVTIDGVSLTIAELGEETFDVALIPHTLEVTTLSDLDAGDRVNVEGDVLARYVRKAVEAAVAAALGSNKR
ncbi:MAG: riboflavin synthase [Acidobacteria bacterium]|nr:riboflavin synthase [Acidobacteriota bacterium]